MNISLSVLSCLFEWKYSHTSWKATPLPQGFPRHLQSRQKGSIFYERPLMCWALGLAFLHLNLAKLAIPPELCIVLIQQQEAAAQHRASSQSNRYPTSHKPWWRLMVVEVSDCNSHSAGTTPLFCGSNTSTEHRNSEVGDKNRETDGSNLSWLFS